MNNLTDEKAVYAQNVVNQPDGPGKRIGKRGEVTVIGKVLPGGGKLFRERVAQFQAEAGYWETRVATVHDFRVHLLDNDTRIMISAIYDGDFLPYLADVIENAGSWFDFLLPGVWEGYTSAKDQATKELIASEAITADVFYAANPELTLHDIAKMKRLSKAVNEMLDAVS